MATFLCKLVPPRSTFPGDMSPAEAGLMQEHAGYLTGLAGQGRVLVAGPVLDPAGAWGMAVIDVPDAEAASQLTANDPIIRSGQGFRYEIHPMPQVILPPAHPSRPV
jgi:uncharacterized protein